MIFNTKPVDPNKRREGLCNKLIERDVYKALVELSKLDSDVVVGYDVVLLRRAELRPEIRFDADLWQEGYTHRERWPSSSEYGRYGWSFRSYGAAKKWYDGMVCEVS